MKRFLALLLSCLPWLTHAAPPRPNVLFLCVDDLKPALGCYGDTLALSPNIDRLAARGVRFDRAYCNQAVCAPSRNNLLLGSRSNSLGIYGLDRNFRTAVPDAVSELAGLPAPSGPQPIDGVSLVPVLRDPTFHQK